MTAVVAASCVKNKEADMSDQCANYQAAVDALQSEIDGIADELNGASSSEKSGILTRQKDVGALLAKAQAQLTKCLKQFPEPTTNVSIAGVEQTQVIQYWGHPLGQGYV